MKRSKQIESNFFEEVSTEVVPVVTLKSGRKIWFVKKELTADTDPVKISELNKKQARITRLLFTAGNALALKSNISP
jgi:hypothetical protein